MLRITETIRTIKTIATNVGERIKALVSPIVSRVEEWLDRYRKYRQKMKRHRQYVDSVLDSECQYDPEQVDIELSLQLRQQLEKLENGDLIERLKAMSLSERQHYFENVLLPMISNAMDVKPNFLGWYQNDKTCGFYSERERGIALNTLFLASDNEYIIRMMVNTVIHECKHARQWDAVAGRNRHGYSDTLIEKWKRNFDDYIQPIESDEGYTKQPVEWDASCFAEQVFPTDNN